jgi:gliding motility-associated-like protein
MPNQDDPKLYVFDRYGKLLKQLYPNGPGWDGTYNGLCPQMIIGFIYHT